VTAWLVPLAGLAALVLTLVLCLVASSRGVMPDAVSARSAHEAPVSRAGGAVLALVFGAVFLAVVLAVGVPPAALNLFVLIACAATLGAIDDAVGLPAVTKLLALMLISGLVALAAGPVPSLPVPFLGWLALPEIVGLALAAFWVLAFVNVFNFLDGLDGMAATTGIVLLCGSGALAAAFGADGLYLFLAVLAAAAWGFAAPNILRGGPFLGDAGSLGLGTAIAGGLLALANGSGLGPGLDGAPFWLLAAAAVPFVADAGITLLQRAAAAESLMEAHSGHAYQRLRRAGWSHQAVGLAYGSISAAVVVLALAFALGVLPGGYAPGAPWLLALLALAAWAAVTRVMFARKAPYEDRAVEASASASSVSRSGERGSPPSEDAALTAYS
jgi:UDP-N-acetylmuramyl pentapeptide phosphotransferase/UDP-N-acetylglucosamine-1-phosphate transferase